MTLAIISAAVAVIAVVALLVSLAVEQRRKDRLAEAAFAQALRELQEARRRRFIGGTRDDMDMRPH